jgi:uncharacterized 2Fe-2S/4Fe-4S cluster protein (DUF4445 family)
MQHTVIFQPDGCRGTCEDGANLMTVARQFGVGLESPCGGSQVCGKCTVQIKPIINHGEISTFSLPEPSEKELQHLSPVLLGQGYRLACCLEVTCDLIAFVPEESRRAQQVILEDGRATERSLSPAVKPYYLEMTKATIEDGRDDFSRLMDALGEQGITQPLSIDISVLRQLPKHIRKGGWKLTVGIWQDKEIIFIAPGRVAELYGVAIDIGTTTIAGFLGNLQSGAVVTKSSLTNSQVQYGDDVLSRVSGCMLDDDGLTKLGDAVHGDINSLIDRLATAAGIDRSLIVDIAVVFNTVMHHIFLGITPDYLGSSPFVSASRTSLDTKARELGIAVASGAYIHSLPIEAGFVGADNVAVLLAEKACSSDRVQLLIDIGTNGEINVSNGRRMLSASCATGPAFEGAQIKHGMRAAPGAIERVWIDSQTREVTIQVIGSSGKEGGQAKAIGICGSGIIDVAAELFKSGLILADGRFDKTQKCERLRVTDKGRCEYVLAWGKDSQTGQDIVITQKDIRAIQLAKSALYAGIKILMQRLGIDQFESVTLAGAFGSYINVESALVIGMFPDCAVENVVVVGNAAGEGAIRALFDVREREEASRIASFVEFVETAAEADFSTHFSDAMFFPHRTDCFPHIQHVLDVIPGAGVDRSLRGF